MILNSFSLIKRYCSVSRTRSRQQSQHLESLTWNQLPLCINEICDDKCFLFYPGWVWGCCLCFPGYQQLHGFYFVLPGRHQAIIWTNAGILLIGPLGANVNEIFIEIHAFSFKKMHLKMSSANWRQFCLGLNVLSRLPIRRHGDIKGGTLRFMPRINYGKNSI